MSSEAYEAGMRRALELAARGPLAGGNPRVGCVFLDEHDEIVAEGWHRGAGTPHAEADALSKLPRHGESAPARGLTAVVTLEPCNHHGRTPPCSAALIDAGAARVVYAIPDPNTRSGGGGERIRQAGIDVIRGIGANDAEEFLHTWLVATGRGRPWVTVKWASTLDGRAAAADGTSQWITGSAARRRVHEQRAQSDAIIVGTGTALADDPALTARGDDGELLPHQPIPVVIGERRVPDGAALRSHPAGLVETAHRDLEVVLSELNDRGVRRAYVEGGPTLASAFVAAGLVDEYAIYLAPALLGGGRLALGDIGVDTIADARRLTIVEVEPLGDDLLITARPTPLSAEPDWSRSPARRIPAPATT